MLAPPEPETLGRVQAFLVPLFRRGDAIPGDAAVEEASAVHVSGNARLTPTEQVDIYRRQFWLRHLEALEDDYPGLRYLVGDEAFDAFCRAYLTEHPPRDPSLRELGHAIVEFADGYHGFDAGVRDAAVEMVAYENAFIDVFDGADVPPIDAAKLAGIPEDAWERARIELHPRIVRRRVTYPVHYVRYAVREGETYPLPLAPSPANLVVFRELGVIRYEELEPTAFELLSALAGGEELGPACERIAAKLDDDAGAAFQERVGAWFQRWTAFGWIVDVVV